MIELGGLILGLAPRLYDAACHRVAGARNCSASSCSRSTRGVWPRCSRSRRAARGNGRAHLRQLKDHMRALRERLHRARRGRAAGGDVAGGRMAARQLPHHLGRRARHPPRSAAVVLPAAAPRRRRRVRRAAAHLRAGARADRIERRPARRAAAAAVHQRLPVGHAADDRRAVGVAERAEARAARPPARARRRARRRPARIGWPPIGWPPPIEAAPDGVERVAGRRRTPPSSRACCSARARSARSASRLHRQLDARARRARPDDRGRDPRRRTAPGGRAGRRWPT